MLKNLNRFWSEESGAIISAELVLVLTIAVLSMVVGLSTIPNAITSELADVADAFGSISQSYEYNGLSYTCTGGGAGAAWNGSSRDDVADVCDCLTLVFDKTHFATQAKCE